MSKLDRAVKKAEAIRWMQILGVSPDVIRQFEDHDSVLVCSEANGRFSEATPAQMEAVREFEQQWDDVVFLIVHSRAFFGRMDSLLFVDNYTDEWARAREDLKEGYVMTWTMNLDHPTCSDMGSIVVERTASGGLVRRF